MDMGNDKVKGPVKVKRVEKRNTRERVRIGVINSTFQELRQFFPRKKAGRRMSKLEILQRAINYIQDLSHSLQTGEITSPSKLASISLPKKPRNKRRASKNLFTEQSDNTMPEQDDSSTSEQSYERNQCGGYHVHPFSIAMHQQQQHYNHHYDNSSYLPQHYQPEHVLSPNTSLSGGSVYSYSSSSPLPLEAEEDQELLSELNLIINSSMGSLQHQPYCPGSYGYMHNAPVHYY